MYSTGHAGGGSVPVGHHFTKRRKQRHKSVIRRTYPEPDLGNGIFASFCREIYWLRRQIQFSLCFAYTDPELDDFEEEFQPTPPVVIPPIEELCRSTGFTKQKVQQLYQEFKRECPSGTLSCEDFCKVMRSIFPKSSNKEYALRVFKALDRNNKGSLRFEDLMTTIIMLMRCSEKERGAWIFAVIDSEQQTSVTFDQFLAYVHSVYSLLGVSPPYTGVAEHSYSTGAGNQCADLKVDWAELENDTRELFIEMDVDKDGIISSHDFETFLHNAKEVSPAIDSILQGIIPNNINRYTSPLHFVDANHRLA